MNEAFDSIELDNFQSPMFVVGSAPELLGRAIEPVISEAIKRGFRIAVVSSFDTFQMLSAIDEKSIYSTVGNFAVAPMAINCFEVPPSWQIVNHAQNLASIVGKIYDLGDADISTLRNGIEKAYVKRGWNLLTNTNFRTSSNNYHAELFPGWEDILPIVAPGKNGAADHDDYEREDESTENGNSLRNVLENITGPINSLVFVSGKSTMNKILDGNHVCNVSALQPEAQLLAAWCIGSWVSELQSQSNHNTDRRLVVLNLSEEACRIQETSAKGPMIFQCADRWSQNASVIVLSRKWNLSKADCFEHGAKIVKLKDELEETAETAPDSLPIHAEKIRSRWLESSIRIEPLVSHGEKFLPEAFLPELYGSVASLSKNQELYRLYARYFLAVQNHAPQLVNYRSKIVSEISMLIGRRVLSKMHVTWLLLSLFTDRFFREKAQFCAWALKEEDELREAWYKLLYVAFVQPDLGLKLEDINAFKEKLEPLQFRQEGPFVGCRFCEKPCQFGHEMSLQMTDNLRFNFNVAINRSDEPASHSAAWSTRLETESWIDANSVDLAYCLAVHQVEREISHRRSTVATLYKVREKLLELSEESEAESTE